MQNKYLISVVIPTYNRANVILDSINSVLNQTYSNIEVIVIDDCSEDNTADILENVSDKRLKYYCLEEKKGANYARNFGVKKAIGDYIAFQDSDDIWHNDKLEKQMKIFDSTEADAVFCPIIQHDKDYKNIYPVLKDDENLLHHVLCENIISTQTLIVKKKVVEYEKFNNSLKRFQDWDLAIRLVNNYDVQYVDEPLVDAYLMSDSISKSPENAVLALQYIISEYEKIVEAENTKVVLENKIIGFAIRAKKYDIAKKYIIDVFKQEKSIRNLIYLILAKIHLLPLIFIVNNERKK